MTASLPPAADVSLNAAGLAVELGRADLADRLTAAATRVVRPATVVCVVGEFKQGKSSLVNALLGQDACPVDDDLATSTLMLLRHGDAVTATVRRHERDGTVLEQIPPESLRSWVTESGNPGNERGVERVDLTLPHPLLATGLILVDTPGMGSLGAGHAANTLAFLPFADGLVFVTDTSAELSAPEIEFLTQARERCPTVIVALTKTDLYPEWRRIGAIDEAHLARAGAQLPVVALSSTVRAIALTRQDPRLDERSGFPALTELLQRDVVDHAKAASGGRALDETTSALDQLEQPLHAELTVLDHPDRIQELQAQYDAATIRLEQLRGPGSRWSVVVNDRVADLSNDVSFRFRGRIRELTRTFDEAIEQITTTEDWDELGRRLQSEIAAAVSDVFVGIRDGGEAIAAEVLTMLGDDTNALPPLRAGEQAFDIGALWGTRDVTEQGSAAARGFSGTMTGLRGAQGGILMFGLMGRFLPTGAAALMLSNPVTLGLGVAFGGLQLVDAHKRKITQRRQLARANVRQFLDDVQFEIGNAVGESLRELSRSFRDEFAARVGELQETYAEAARAAQQAADADAAEAHQRRAIISVALDRLAALRDDVEAAR